MEESSSSFSLYRSYKTSHINVHTPLHKHHQTTKELHHLSEREREGEGDRQTQLPAKKQKSDQTEKREFLPPPLPPAGESGDPVQTRERVAEGGEMGMMPGWVAGLVAETFFVGCPAHETRKKNEKNIFCLGCCASICTHCAPAHRRHPLLQVRRYVYNDVVRLDDMENLIDCSYVQSYTINSAKVIFLKPRPQSRPFKGSGNVCLKCNRMLQEPFHFCCLSCKVDHVMMQQGGDLSNILQYYGGGDPEHLAFPRFENLRVDGSDLDDDTDGGTVTPNSILEDPTHRYAGGGSGSSDNARNDGDGGSFARRGEAAAVKRKKGGGFLPQIMLSLGNRRKGAPHRSPLA